MCIAFNLSCGSCCVCLCFILYLLRIPRVLSLHFLIQFPSYWLASCVSPMFNYCTSISPVYLRSCAPCSSGSLCSVFSFNTFLWMIPLPYFGLICCVSLVILRLIYSLSLYWDGWTKSCRLPAFKPPKASLLLFLEPNTRQDCLFDRGFGLESRAGWKKNSGQFEGPKFSFVFGAYSVSLISVLILEQFSRCGLFTQFQTKLYFIWSVLDHLNVWNWSKTHQKYLSVPDNMTFSSCLILKWLVTTLQWQQVIWSRMWWDFKIVYSVLMFFRCHIK